MLAGVFTPIVAEQLSKADFWHWHPHPEVWLLVAGIVGCYFYATRVVGPKVVAPGQPVITKAQRRWFIATVLTLWAAADWPIHDWAEGYLYSVHMVQHLMLTMLVAPMALLATPEWLPRVVLGRGRVYRGFRFCTRPLIAGGFYAAIFALGHWPKLVALQVENGPFHFMSHLVYVVAAMAMWNCVCGPLPELRISVPAQIGYLFLLSIPPTVPGGWLVFADSVVYKSYNHPYRLFGLSPVSDQQLAGFIMKVVGGFFLWIVIFVIFFRWNQRNEIEEKARREAEDREFWAGVEAAVAFGLKPKHRTLTFEDVEAEFKQATAPREPG